MRAMILLLRATIRSALSDILRDEDNGTEHIQAHPAMPSNIERENTNLTFLGAVFIVLTSDYVIIRYIHLVAQ